MEEFDDLCIIRFTNNENGEIWYATESGGITEEEAEAKKYLASIAKKICELYNDQANGNSGTVKATLVPV